jgi:tetratricopeptide (TPR) repeat protein
MTIEFKGLLSVLQRIETLSSSDFDSVASTFAESRDAEGACRWLVDNKKLTPFQGMRILNGEGESLFFAGCLLVDKIGQGGMGQVYRALQPILERHVAIKMLIDSTPQMIRRFKKESKIVAKFNHPNIVRAYSAGEHNDVCYLVMEYIEGCDLDQLTCQGQLPVGDAVNYIVQAAHGLKLAHASKIVHRDIKPANLLLANDGTVKVLDLGLAREIQSSLPAESPADSELTGPGQILGTIDYMAPEQFSASSQADHRADIYSLGCCLYFLLIGNPLFTGKTRLDRLLAHRDQPIPSLRQSRPDCAAELDAVYKKMVAKKPHDRFQSMQEVIEALSSVPRCEPTPSGFEGETLPMPAPFAARELPALDTFGSRGPARKVIIEVTASHTAGTKMQHTVRVRGSGAMKQGPFDPREAAQLAQLFYETVEFEHGTRDPAGRSEKHCFEYLGGHLRRHALAGEIGLEFDRLCDEAGKALEVWVHGPAAVVNLPWEILNRREHTLFHHDNVPVARTFEPRHRQSEHGRPLPQEKLRVLFVPAQPNGHGPVHWKETLAELQNRLWCWQLLGLLELEVLGRADEPNTLDRLRSHLGQKGHFDVVHVLAHGSTKGAPQIALVGKDREADWKTARELIPHLTWADQLPRLVLLGCCHLSKADPDNAFGGISQQLLEQGVPAVLSMQSAVSTRVAAAAAGTILQSILKNQSIGRAVVDCRHELGREWPLPVLWLHPKWEMHKPLFDISPKAVSQLLDEVDQHVANPLLDETIAEQMLARMHYVRETGALPSKYDDLRGLFEEKLLDAIGPQLQRAIESSSRESVSRFLLYLRTRCRVSDRPFFKEAHQWVTNPLRNLLNAGQEHESDRDWDQAIACYDQAWELSADGENTEILWRDLRELVWQRRRFALGNQQLLQADRLGREGKWTAAIERIRSGVALLRWLADYCPRQFPHLGTTIAQREQQLVLQALLGTAWEHLERFAWRSARDDFRAAHQLQPDFADDIKFAEDCEKMSEAFQRACDLALNGEWEPACVLFDREFGLVPAPNQDDGSAQQLPANEKRCDNDEGRAGNEHPARQDPAAVRQFIFGRWCQELDAVNQRRRWERAWQTQHVLDRLLKGLAVECQEWESPDVVKALQIGALDESRVTRARGDIEWLTSEDFQDLVPERLQADGAAFFVLQNDWATAHRVVGRLVDQQFDVTPVWHQLGIAGLQQAICGQGQLTDELLAQHWQGSLRAWSKALANKHYWDLRGRTEGSWTDGRYAQLVDGLRRFLSDRLTYRADAAQVLERASRFFTMSLVEYGELVEIGMELAERVLENENFKMLGPVWQTTLKHAHACNRIESTSGQIYDRARTWAERWRSIQDLDALDRRVSLWQAATSAVPGTSRHFRYSQHSLARAHYIRGLRYLDSDSIGNCYRDEESACNLERVFCTSLALMVALVALAAEATHPSERNRLYTRARDELRQACEQWPGNADLATLKSRLDNGGQRNDSHYFELFARLLELFDEWLMP